MIDVDRLLRRHLVSVEPAEGFRRRMRAELLEAHPAKHSATTTSWLWLFAGLGGVLSLGSLAVVAVRRGPAWVARFGSRRGATVA